jgi:hypothetical protein
MWMGMPYIIIILNKSYYLGNFWIITIYFVKKDVEILNLLLPIIWYEIQNNTISKISLRYDLIRHSKKTFRLALGYGTWISARFSSSRSAKMDSSSCGSWKYSITSPLALAESKKYKLNLGTKFHTCEQSFIPGYVSEKLNQMWSQGGKPTTSDFTFTTPSIVGSRLERFSKQKKIFLFSKRTRLCTLGVVIFHIQLWRCKSRGKLWPPGAKLSPRGEFCPLGVKLSSGV